jgi:replicative DNA helicase
VSEELRKYGKRSINEFTDHNLGKLPPQAVELEIGVLGAVLQDKDAINIVENILKPESFYKSEHQLIYTAIVNLSRKSYPIDILTVTHELRRMGELENAGGVLNVSSLTNTVASSANLEYHSRIICEKYILRELIKIAGNIQNKAYAEETDTFELLDEFNSGVGDVMSENVKQDALPIRSLTGAMMKDVEKRQNSDENFVSGIPTYINSVDKVLGGFKNSDLIMIAARPAMGKTSFILSCALNQAKRGHKMVIFSLEMSKNQLVQRLAAQEAEIDLYDLANKKLDITRIENLNRAIGVIESLPIWIDDTPALSVFDLRAKAIRLKKQYGIEIIYLDYLQLCTAGKFAKKLVGNETAEVSMISKTLKQIAKEVDVPLVSLSQLSRGVEARSNKRPMPSDLRSSGSLEQDSDIIAFLYRGEEYGDTETHDGRSTAGLGEVIISKHRNGSTGTAYVRWIPYLTKYADENYYSNPPINQVEKPLPANNNFLNNRTTNNNDAPF